MQKACIHKTEYTHRHTSAHFQTKEGYLDMTIIKKIETHEKEIQARELPESSKKCTKNTYRIK